MNGVELFLLGRTLMKLGEDALPEPPGGSGRYPGGTRNVLIAAGDVAAHPGTTVGEVATRTGLPQSQISTAVARLKEAGAVTTAPDPADRRRTLLHPAARPDRVAEIRSAGIDGALAAALGGDPDPDRLAELTAALDVLARHLLPGGAP